MLACNIVGKEIPGTRKLFECKASHQQQKYLCCNNKQTVLRMIKQMVSYLVEKMPEFSNTQTYSSEDIEAQPFLDGDMTIEENLAGVSDDCFVLKPQFYELEHLLKKLILANSASVVDQLSTTSSVDRNYEEIVLRERPGDTPLRKHPYAPIPLYA